MRFVKAIVGWLARITVTFCALRLVIVDDMYTLT
jgi:hypothetical protein